MRRRKLAWALAGFLGVLALLAGTAWAVLVLPARDYRLAWMLGKTKRISVEAYTEHRCLRRETSQPDLVAEVVSVMRSKLDRRRCVARRFYAVRWRFFLENGDEIVLASDPVRLNPELDRTDINAAFEEVAIRLPGRDDFEVYSLDAPTVENEFEEAFRMGTQYALSECEVEAFVSPCPQCKGLAVVPLVYDSDRIFRPPKSRSGGPKWSPGMPEFYCETCRESF